MPNCAEGLFVSDTYNNDSDDLPEDAPVEPLILPLDAWHKARGARMVPFAGYIMPVQYEGIIAEHVWTRQHVGLFDVSHMGQLEVSGEGMVAALEALLPGDFTALKPGRVRYSLLLDDNGNVLDDLMVTNRGDTFYLVVNGATKWDDMAHLREALADDITLTLLDEHGLLALQGPQAASVLASLGLTSADGAPPVTELSFMQAGAYLWQDRPLGISRSGYTGEDGFEISVQAQDIAALADALAAHEEVKPIGLGARDSLRLEAGLPLYGHDLDEEIDPISADLSFAVSKRRRMDAGFLGAVPIINAIANGPKSKRVGLLVEGKMPVREGALLFAGAEQIGRVTSGGHSPTLDRPIAMGFVTAAYAKIGTSLEAEVRGKRVPVQVTAMPFVPHHYVRKGAAQ